MRRLTGWLLVAMGVVLFALLAEPYLPSLGVALPYAVAGWAVLTRRRWGKYLGLGLASAGVVVWGLAASLANSGSAHFFADALFGAGPYSWWDVLFIAVAFALANAIALGLVVSTWNEPEAAD